MGAAPDHGERMIIAQILENAYTAIETALLRISQGFDNSLSPERWHADLLDKMVLEKKGVRPRVLSNETHRLLTELMRFRHFKRYYIELDYDWEKLRFLLSVLRRCLPLVKAEPPHSAERSCAGLKRAEIPLMHLASLDASDANASAAIAGYLTSLLKAGADPHAKDDQDRDVVACAGRRTHVP